MLFLDNGPSHRDIFKEKNIKLKFLPKKVLPKITTSRLQACDTGIIKTLNINIESCWFATFSFVSTRLIELQRKLSKMSISWKSSNGFDTSWADVSEKTIKNYFEKCHFGNPNVVVYETVDHEFERFCKNLVLT